MNKKFVKVPSSSLEKIMLSAKLTESISGTKTTLKEILDSIEKHDIKLNEEEIKEIEKEFS